MFIYPTPVGCYYAISSLFKDKARDFIKQLLQLPSTPELNLDSITKLMEVETEQEALDLLHFCQKRGWVQGVKKSIELPKGALDKIIPILLGSLSETGDVLLSDAQGFHLACCGFSNETADQLSAISAEIETIHNRRRSMLENNLTIDSHAWAIVDAFGGSQLGFWPLFIGNTQFVLTISGIPHFNRPEFTTLIWALSNRYQQI